MVFYHLNNGNLDADMPSHTADDIDFKDIGLRVDAYAGNGEWDLPGNARYTFGSDEDDTDITGGSKDDHLYESSPKAFSPQRAVFEFDLAA